MTRRIKAAVENARRKDQQKLAMVAAKEADKARVKAAKAMVAALEDGLALIDALMPGIASLALQNYATVNDTPIAMHKAIAMAKAAWGTRLA